MKSHAGLPPLETFIEPHEGCEGSARLWADTYRLYEADFAGEVAAVYMVLAAQVSGDGGEVGE